MSVGCDDFKLKRITLRRDTSVNWARFNPILCTGEFGWDSTVLNFKIGDGVNRWTALLFFNTSAGSAHIIEDEGVALPQRGNLNFVGASVTVTDDPPNNATVVTIIANGGGGSEITDSSKISALQLNTNWGTLGNYDFIMINNESTVLAGQSEHDYMIGIDSNTNSIYKYEIIKISTSLNVIRIPLKIM